MVVTEPRTSSRTEPQRSGFDEACIYCGARFHVQITQRRGDTTTQPYACPECGRANEVQSVQAPQVSLVSPRRDGKDDPYQETMF